jgi:hypothetical protein
MSTTAPDTMGTTTTTTTDAHHPHGHHHHAYNRPGAWLLFLTFLTGLIFSIAGTATPWAVKEEDQPAPGFENQIGIWQIWQCDNDGNNCIARSTEDTWRCKTERDRFRVLKGFSIMSIGFNLLGLIAALMEALGHGKPWLTMLMLFLAFSSALIVFAVQAGMYRNYPCSPASLTDQDYELRASFALFVVTAGILFLSGLVYAILHLLRRRTHA